MKTINKENWARKEHFDFFSKFDEPYWGIVVEVDCTKAYHFAKNNNVSFFALYLHNSLLAINEIPEFKYRIDGKKIVVFDKIHASPTIGRSDNTFSFGYIEFDKDFEVFHQYFKNETERVQNTTGLGLNKNTARIDTVHYSTVPWYKFTGLTHARSFNHIDSVPKITFGKASNNHGNLTMPVSINAHHGLVDGLHAGQFIDLFQNLLNQY